jgi:hypothetical protein
VKFGAIYIAHNPRDGVNTFKVGKTERSPDERMKELTAATSNLGTYTFKSFFVVEDMNLAERVCHDRLSRYRVQSNREFFELPFSQLLQIVEDEIEPFLATNFVPEVENVTNHSEVSSHENLYEDQFPPPKYKKNECSTPNVEIISSSIFKCFYCDSKIRITSFSENKLPICSVCKIKPFDEARFKLLCRLYKENNTWGKKFSRSFSWENIQRMGEKFASVIGKTLHVVLWGLFLIFILSLIFDL